MPRMIELIRTSQVPSNLMQSAARGSLSVPPTEMIEILVHLALHNKIFGQQARLTLAAWDEKACLAAAQNPMTSAEVLGYWTSAENFRPTIFAMLVENPSVAEDALCRLAIAGGRPMVEAFLGSSRVKHSPELLKALRTNPNVRPAEMAEIEKKLAPSAPAHSGATTEPEASEHDEAAEEVLGQYLKENAHEIETLKEKPFHAHGDESAEIPAPSMVAAPTAVAPTVAVPIATPARVSAAAKSGPVAAVGKPGHAAAVAHAKVAHDDEKRDSAVQKIAKLDVKGRISLAVRGNKEERSILIRDMTKVVCLAVLESPKLTDAEVEGFAQQKNVLDSVLRTIPMKRRFAKNYTVQRNLVANPRTPTDASLGLIKNLLPHDLKNLAENKEVPETIRKTAMRMFRQKMERHKS